MPAKITFLTVITSLTLLVLPWWQHPLQLSPAASAQAGPKPIEVTGFDLISASEGWLRLGQRLIDVIKGYDTPEAVPGFIGSVNELESLTLLRSVKHLLFLLNWLLVDPAERDDPPKEVDYEVLVKPTPPGSPGFYQATPPSGRPPVSSGWPSTSCPMSRPVTPPPPPSPPPPYETDLFGTGPGSAGGLSPVNGQAGPATPANRYKDHIRIDGRDCPLVVKRVVTSPINGGRRKVDAIYYDDRLQEWRDVVDEEVRSDLARAVEAGLASVVEPGQWPATHP